MWCSFYRVTKHRNSHGMCRRLQTFYVIKLLCSVRRYTIYSSSSLSGSTTLSWVLACSTIVEHSQQKDFTECRCQRHVEPPTWKTRDLERSNSRHKGPSASVATLANPATEGGTMDENFAESGDFYVTFGFFYMP
jgi:hypothetical protein